MVKPHSQSIILSYQQSPSLDHIIRWATTVHGGASLPPPWPVPLTFPLRKPNLPCQVFYNFMLSKAKFVLNIVNHSQTRIQIDLLHTKVWFKTFILIFWFKNVSAASPGWVASSPTSSPPVAQKPGFFDDFPRFKIPEMGQGTNGAITFWIGTKKLRPF